MASRLAPYRDAQRASELASEQGRAVVGGKRGRAQVAVLKAGAAQRRGAQVPVEKADCLKSGTRQICVVPRAVVKGHVGHVAVDHVGSLEVASAEGAVLETQVFGLHHRQGGIPKVAV